MSNKWFQENKDKFFKKYSDKELIEDIENYKYKNGNLGKIFRHFFDEVMYKAVGNKGRPVNSTYNAKTPYDFINDDDCINFCLTYISRHKEFFNANDDDIVNIKSYFRNKNPRKVAQFPVKQAQKIIFDNFPDYDLFEEPLNIHDPSCGFGSRMSAVLLEGCNYYGTDPNLELFVALEDYYKFLKLNRATRGSIDIRNIGSEVFVPEWENMMDISFTSPPYFNLEIYSSDKSASTKNYNNYELWKQEYMYPTCKNIKKYLKNKAVAMINIKNISKKEPIFDDFVKCFESLDMKRLSDAKLKINKKSFNYDETSTEPVMVFQKI